MKIKTTRSKIVKAMYDLLAEQSYDKSSIGQIADMIGIKKASVYYYFRFKEEILIELVKYLYTTEDENEKSLTIVKDKETFKEYLLNEGLFFIDAFQNNPKARRVFAEIDIQTSRIPSLKKFVESYNLTIKEKWLNIINYGLEIKAFSENFDVKSNAEFLFTVLTGIDDALLYKYPINTIKVWEIAVNAIMGDDES